MKLTEAQLESAINELLGAYPAADLYESNKANMKLVSDGFMTPQIARISCQESGGQCRVRSEKWKTWALGRAED